MDLKGIPKRAWRARIIEAYYGMTGEEEIPYKQYFFTLGGPATDKDSEYNYMVGQRKFMLPSQYVSVERDKRIHAANSKIKRDMMCLSPTWLHGDFASQFRLWMEMLQAGWNPAIVSADLMCGVSNALPTMRSVLATLDTLRVNDRHKTLVVFNVLHDNRQRRNQGKTFDPVLPTVRKDLAFQYYMRNGMQLVDQFKYENKTVGKGAGMSVFQTLMYWL